MAVSTALQPQRTRGGWDQFQIQRQLAVASLTSVADGHWFTVKKQPPSQPPPSPPCHTTIVIAIAIFWRQCVRVLCCVTSGGGS
jgi:hypothetical protein